MNPAHSANISARQSYYNILSHPALWEQAFFIFNHELTGQGNPDTQQLIVQRIRYLIHGLLFSLLKRLFNSKHMTRTTLWCIQRGAKCQIQVKFTPDMEL